MLTRRDFLGIAAASGATPLLPNLLTSMPTKPNGKVVRLAEDRFDLVLAKPERFRMLQITDTHFGTPKDSNRLGDSASRKLIRTLVEEQKPDLVFHTGDFINNDTEGVEHGAIDFMNDLGTPWSLVFGNHDHPSGGRNTISLDDYYKRLQNHATGYHTEADGKRSYCFRIDVRAEKGKPVLSLIGFNCGSPNTAMIVTQAQTEWLRAQLEADRSAGLQHPILVMQHIPTIEYKTVFADKLATGRQGEEVCFEVDKGEIFEVYRASGRVRGVFCGHDHVNDYYGDLKGVRLVYGRVTGWSGYGDWQRGGRLIGYTPADRQFRTKVVLPKGAVEKAEWSRTLTEV